MDREAKPGETEEASSPIVTGPRLTRRAVFAGMGSTLLVDGARPVNLEDLQLFFANDRHEEIVIVFGGVELRWGRIESAPDPELGAETQTRDQAARVKAWPDTPP